MALAGIWVTAVLVSGPVRQEASHPASYLSTKLDTEREPKDPPNEAILGCHQR